MFERILLSFSMIPTAVAAMDDPLFRTVIVDSAAGLEVGRGCDILTGNPRADCADRTMAVDHTQFGPDVLLQSPFGQSGLNWRPTWPL